ncbi:toxin-antitoxin system YwqK family antitoxin [Weeksellaceae bacterium TAE3-ERU29]|nr:toxin-antitoxin system YwqK family antitoxin [Weeksellaceae bacterium TAE3-ERU29]
MIKLKITILLLFFSILAFGQKEYKAFYANGQLRDEGQLNKNGKPVGEWKSYYPSGKVLMISNYENGEIKGNIKSFDENGKLIQIIHSETGLTESFDESGKLWCFGKQKNGKKEGKWTFLSNGITQKIQNYENGQLNGEYKSYNDNGKLYCKGNYENGKRVGEWKFYFSNGSLKEIGYYQNDKSIGTWTQYDKEGKAIFIRHYENGNLMKTEDIKNLPFNSQNSSPQIQEINP